ncbi:MAG: hypothetical protein FJ100_21450 [Deltaproteobacteria bacterium]|nr:hypothetical protein [Deltaproteobacteria bacterium]
MGNFGRFNVGVRGLALMAVVAACHAACSEEKPSPGASDAAKTDTGPADGTPVGDVAAINDTPIEDSADAAPDDGGPDSGTTDAKVAGDADGAQVSCVSDDQCSKTVVKKCEKPVCDKALGQCKGQKNPNLCCDDGDCDDANECTSQKCNTDTAACEYSPIQNCCKGKETPLVLDFEQKSLQGFQAEYGPTNGNVKWNIETKRTHGGKYALYFGNECYTYDAAQTSKTGCLGGDTGGAVSTKLKSTTVNLTPGKQFLLHFWLWLDTEPSWLKAPDVKKGTCATPCKSDEVCVQLSNTSQCLVEKDVLKVSINGVPLDWNSVAIGKSTNGNWQHIAVDLAKFSGKGIAVSWEFSTGTNGLKNKFEGIYLDDIRIESVCGTVNDKDVTCDAAKKCVDDKKPCTVDECTPFVNAANGAGLCFSDMIPGCCSALVDCNDNNDCTIDSCPKAAGAEQGICKNVPNAANLQCCKPDNLLKEGFDNGDSTWTKTENSKVVKWQTDPKGGQGGGPGLRFSDASYATYDDPTIKPKGPAGTICSLPKKLGSGTLYNVASFSVNLSTEWDKLPADKYKNPAIAGEPKLDELKLVVYTNGQYCGATECKAPNTGMPAGLWSSDAIAGTTKGEWVPVTVSLDKFAGKDVQLCFHFDAGDEMANKASGARIDDVSIDITCTDKPCTADKQCDGQCGKCEVGLCQDNTCLCKAVPGCCTTDAQCDDKDTCTDDKCAAGSCAYTLTSPTCCSNKGVLDQAFDSSDGKLPDGWKSSFLKGVPPISGGKPYSTLVGWGLTPTKAKSGQYSLYFGTNGVTYNAGNEVPAAVVRSPDIEVPKNGTTLLTFQLYLSTEWNPPPNDPNFVFKAPPDPIYTDRLRIGAYDAAATDPNKVNGWWWNSYSIEGSTNGKFQSVVIKVPDEWKGKKIKLQFEFDAGTVSNNNYEGVFIDSMQLSTVCEAPPCIDDAMCKPAKPDPCKKYICAKDPNALLFSCTTDFKAGPGCCAQSTALAVQTFEGGQLADSGWVPSGNSQVAKWRVIPKKYCNGKFEAYFGNEDATNYADGANGVSGALANDKAITLNFDAKNAAWLQFKLYLDIEKTFETFEVRVTVPGTTVKGEVVWTHTNKAHFDYEQEAKKLVEKKVDLAKYKGKGGLIIEFFFDSKDGINNAKNQGIFLDDITIVEPCL